MVDLDLDAILRALKDHNCGGRILCESPILEEDALNIKEAWYTLTGSHA
jgi:deoxyribonuclease-4